MADTISMEAYIKKKNNGIGFREYHGLCTLITSCRFRKSNKGNVAAAED
jgi:hypothetical protein